jgi:diguanylate cyclase (GGDEF)-like protein/PAS domain S-box-containing protein
MAKRLEEASEELKSSESRYRLLAENAADLVTRTDASGRRVYASPSSRTLLGYEPEELIGKSPLDIAHPLDRAPLAVMLDTLQRGEPADAVQYRMRRRDGSYIWVETNGRPLGKGQGIVCSVRDISQRKCVEDKLEEANRNLLLLASTDGLTGLANRRAFDKALLRETARCARDALPIVLLLIDVDCFKSYNDSYGHQEGDECLKRVSHLLRNLARRPGDVAARYGGEEFAIVLPNTTADGGRRFAERLRTGVEDMRIPHCRSAFGVVTVSVGLACETPVAGVEDGIVAKADAALYAAKENGRNRVEFYTSNTQPIETRRYGA